MARPVNGAARSLVAAARNRMWLQAAATAVGRAAVLGSALLLAGGLYHLFVTPLPMRRVVVLSLVPLAWGLLISACRRPALSAAARAADRWFDGKNLLASAWEIQGRGGRRSGTDALVVLRAEAQAAKWRTHIGSAQPLHRPQHLAVPLLVALSGIFLMQLPSKHWLAFTDPRDGGGAARPSEHHAEPPRVAPPPAAPPAAPREDAYGAARTAAAPAGSGAEQTAHLARRADAAPGADRRNAPAQGPARSETPAAAPASGGGRAADRPGARTIRDLPVRPPSLRVSEIGIARTPGTAGTADAAGQLNDAEAQHAPAHVDSGAVPAARHARSPYRADSSPALRAYMTRYFAALASGRHRP